MKRSLVKHGPSSHVIALPHEWIKRQQLHAGNEVDIQVKDEKLIISSTPIEIIEQVTLHTSALHDLIDETISALYKRGVDEIIINYSSPEDFARILRSVDRRELGYEIFETHKNKCIIKRITKLTDEFDSILRRIFLVTLAMADEGYSHLYQCDSQSLESISILERSNDKLTVFCRRYLNKREITSYDKIGPLYYIIETLEKIADEYRYLYEDFCKTQIKKLPPKELLVCLESVNKSFRLYYEAFYEHKLDKLKHCKQIHDDIFTKLRNQARTIHTISDFYLYTHIYTLNERVYSMLDPFLVLHTKKYVSGISESTEQN